MARPNDKDMLDLAQDHINGDHVFVENPEIPVRGCVLCITAESVLEEQIEPYCISTSWLTIIFADRGFVEEDLSDDDLQKAGERIGEFLKKNIHNKQVAMGIIKGFGMRIVWEGADQ